MRDALSSAVFIDRDGTIIEDTDYCSHAKDVRIFPGVLEALRRLKSQGFNGLVDATYYCPDAPGQHSKCRKPAPGMVVKATQDHQIDLSRSFLIGDKEVDVECAHNAGVRAIRVRTGIQRDMTGSNADWVADDVPAAVRIILDAKS